MTVCAIMQPTYLPWLGYFDLIRQADVFVLLDHVQFSKQSWQQRNRIRDCRGEIMLTVPIKHSTLAHNSIARVEIDHSRGVLAKHMRAITQNYARSRNKAVFYDDLGAIFSNPGNSLAVFNSRLIELGCRLMGIDTPVLYSSDMGIQGDRVEGIIEICHATDADHYSSPPGAATYIDQDAITTFNNNNIGFSYHQFVHPTYAQCDYPDFISHLAFIDYLFNAESPWTH